jgi:hypothetical protein
MREETEMNTDGVETDGKANPTVAGEAVELVGGVPPRTGDRARRRLRLGAGWRFARHLLEMVVAMMVGMAVLGAMTWALGEPPGYANLFVKYGLMGASMSVPMVGWMRYRGHAWSDGGEMVAAMLLAMFALVVPVELGVAVPGLPS